MAFAAKREDISVMLGKRILLSALLVMSAAAPALAQFQDFPRPVLGLVEQIRRGNFNEIYLIVTNWNAYPPALFAAAPNLPPCDQNQNSARTWVDIYDGETKAKIGGHCAINAPNGLAKFAVTTLITSKPKSVFIWLNDRELKRAGQSNTLVIP
jgi:hypothetical protein